MEYPVHLQYTDAEENYLLRGVEVRLHIIKGQDNPLQKNLPDKTINQELSDLEIYDLKVKMERRIMFKKYNTNKTPTTSDNKLTQEALNWWNSLPIQDIYEGKLGWANLATKHFPNTVKDIYHLTSAEVVYIYVSENDDKESNN